SHEVHTRQVNELNARNQLKTTSSPEFTDAT
ncbi:MAG: hypothetical protein ACI853_000491, partial [Paracoccaceae bacterium]